MKKIWIHKAKSFADAERWDRWFWRRAGAQARFAAAWSMVRDYWKMQGKSDVPRLQKNVQRIVRLK